MTKIVEILGGYKNKRRKDNMNKKITFVLIALLGIGLYALPATVALFSGQHDFVNIDPTGNQINCIKCHGDVKAEMASSGLNLQTGTPAPHAAFKCEYCHRIEAGAASGDNAYAIITYAGVAVPPLTTKPMRTLAITMTDFEEENFPGSPKHPGEGVVNNAPNVSVAVPGYVFGNGGAAISPIVAGYENETQVLTLSNEYERGTYNRTTGQPLDTSANKLMGLTLSKIPMDATGWTAYKSTQRYWTPTLLNAGSKAVNPGTEYHAASLVSCLECHGGFEPLGHYSRVLDDEVTYANNDEKCAACHYGYTNRWTELSAGGFGITGGNDTGAQEAHMEFQTTDDGMTQYKAVGTASYSNGACISCHTHVNVDITYTKPDTLKFAATFVSPTGTENLTAQEATGAVVSTSP